MDARAQRVRRANDLVERVARAGKHLENDRYSPELGRDVVSEVVEGIALHK